MARLETRRARNERRRLRRQKASRRRHPTGSSKDEAASPYMREQAPLPTNAAPASGSAAPTPAQGLAASEPADHRPFYLSPTWHWPVFDPECCQECGRVIPMHETGWILEELILCEDCFTVLDEQKSRRGSVVLAPACHAAVTENAREPRFELTAPDSYVPRVNFAGIAPPVDLSAFEANSDGDGSTLFDFVEATPSGAADARRSIAEATASEEAPASTETSTAATADAFVLTPPPAYVPRCNFAGIETTSASPVIEGSGPTLFEAAEAVTAEIAAPPADPPTAPAEPDAALVTASIIAVPPTVAAPKAEELFEPIWLPDEDPLPPGPPVEIDFKLTPVAPADAASFVTGDALPLSDEAAPAVAETADTAPAKSAEEPEVAAALIAPPPPPSPSTEAPWLSSMVAAMSFDTGGELADDAGGSRESDTHASADFTATTPIDPDTPVGSSENPVDAPSSVPASPAFELTLAPAFVQPFFTPASHEAEPPRWGMSDEPTLFEMPAPSFAAQLKAEAAAPISADAPSFAAEPAPQPLRLPVLGFKARRRSVNSDATDPAAPPPLTFHHPVDKLLTDLHNQHVDAQIWASLNRWRRMDPFYGEAEAMLEIALEHRDRWMSRSEKAGKPRSHAG